MSANLRVSPLTLRHLDRSTCAGTLLVLPEQLEAKDYRAVDRVLRAAGGRWDRRAGGHRFAGNAEEAIEPILLTGEVLDRKQELGQFATPMPLAERVAEAAGIARGHRVLEPSAGLGALAVQAALRGGRVDVVEIDPACCAVMAEFNCFDAIRCGDFLTRTPEPVYDRVVMNPPFAGQADIRHVFHAANFLTPGGRLVAICSEAVTFRRTALAIDFRAFLAGHGARVEFLGEGAFRESGTAVRTVLIVFDLAGGEGGDAR